MEAKYQDYEWLYQERVVNKRTNKELADYFGVCAGTIQKWVIKLGLSQYLSDTPLYSDPDWLFNEIYVRGSSAQSISNELGVDESTITKYCRRYNILIPRKFRVKINTCDICGCVFTTQNICKNHQGMFVCKSCRSRIYNAKPESKAAHEAYRKTSVGKQKAKDWQMRNYYGISLDVYNTMLESQGGVCAICGRKDEISSLSVDHDHSTGKTRKLLCRKCNKALGLFNDDPELVQQATNYLLEHKEA